LYDETFINVNVQKAEEGFFNYGCPEYFEQRGARRLPPFSLG
jgi:hypothetical protein